MYLIKQIPDDPRKLEMCAHPLSLLLSHEADGARRARRCFDCSAFQFQLDQGKPFEDHVFQTIFLNKDHEKYWSNNEINKDKISASCPAEDEGGGPS